MTKSLAPSCSATSTIRISLCWTLLTMVSLDRASECLCWQRCRNAADAMSTKQSWNCALLDSLS